MNSSTNALSAIGAVTEVTVEANKSWQTSGVTIPPGIEVTLVYQSGLWTADPQNNGGQPYNGNGDPSIIVPENQTSYPIPGAHMGALVGRIGGGEPFLVGDGTYAILTATSGELELCINDDLTGQYGAGLTDNSGSITVTVSVYNNTNTAPDLSQSLVRDPQQTSPSVPLANLGPLKYLLGTWTNQNLPGTNQGGPDSPYGYNVMPLPQVDPSSPTGYILKNFTYYEELSFTAIHGNAPNRGGIGQQVAYTIFYEQRVYFAEGPNKDALVHAENGSLLYLLDSVQPLGPYGNGDQPGLNNREVTNSVAPTQSFNLVKQVSVPHGNSILALGNYSEASKGTGVPPIAEASALPSGINTEQYVVEDPVTNPQPKYTANPNQVLVDALKARPCMHFITLTVNSKNGSGGVTNIGFEQQHANVSQYEFTYWLEAFEQADNYTQLQYSQTITLQIPIDGKTVTFPHVTANTLTKLINS